MLRFISEQQLPGITTPLKTGGLETLLTKIHDLRSAQLGDLY